MIFRLLWFSTWLISRFELILIEIQKNMEPWESSFLIQKIGARPEALKEVISSAEMDIIMPDGKEIDVEMHDDGLHGDLVC